MQARTMNNPSAPLTIGALAQRTGLNVSAIRYYEEIGLIPAATRRPSGHRVYSAGAEDLLTFIRRCRGFGFSVEDTKALVSLASVGDSDCVEARDIAQMHLQAVRERLAELQGLERTLSAYVTDCGAQCAGGPASGCTILKDLGDAGAGRTTAGATTPRPPARCCG